MTRISTMANNEFGIRLKSKRVEAGLRKKQLADAMGVSPSLITRWEAARLDNQDIRNLRAACLALDCSADELLGIREFAELPQMPENLRSPFHEVAEMARSLMFELRIDSFCFHDAEFMEELLDRLHWIRGPSDLALLKNSLRENPSPLRKTLERFGTTARCRFFRQ